MSSAGRYSWERADGTTGRGWRARWTGPDGQPKSKRGFDRKGDAEAYAADREAEARHGVTLQGDRPTGKTTVRQWAAVWLEAQTVRPNTYDGYRAALRRVEATFGDRALTSLRPSEIKAWRKALGQRYAASTAQQTATVLGMLLRAAVTDGLLERSPMPAARGGASGRVVDPDELLTLQQVRAFDAALPAHARGMALVAATTGVRQGELLGLTADRVDWLRRQVRIDRQLQRGQLEPPKTAASERTVPLPEVAAQALSAHVAAYPSPEGEPLFLSGRGTRWSRTGFQGTWARAHARAGLPEWATWHSLRDVYASALIRRGVDLRTVMTYMGHASSEETLRVYARLWGDAHDLARQQLDDLWRPEITAPQRDAL